MHIKLSHTRTVWRLSLLRLIQACKKQRKKTRHNFIFLSELIEVWTATHIFTSFTSFTCCYRTPITSPTDWLTSWFESFSASLCVRVESYLTSVVWFIFFTFLNWIARAQSVTDSVVTKWFWHGQRTHFTRLSLHNSLKWTLDKLTCHLNWITLIKFEFYVWNAFKTSLFEFLPGWLL